MVSPCFRYVLLCTAWLLTGAFNSATSECDDAISAATRRAAAVFTGRVDAFLPSDPDVAMVTVKRVLKKDPQSSPFDSLEAGRRVRVRVSQSFVDVQGKEEGDSWCDYEASTLAKKSRVRKLRVRDTKMFLLRRSEGRHKRLLRDGSSGFEPVMELDSQPLTLSLTLLDRASAAVKDIIYKPRTPIVEEPCEKTYCQFGADCVTRPDGSAHCECPTSCSTVFTPVCGTDGVTYSNHCLMRMRACQESENIRAQYSGECGAQPRPKGRRG